VTVESRRGTTEELHGLDPESLLGERPSAVVVMEPTDRAVVLGSSQPDDLVDAAAAARAGLAVTRRRSGGGIVVTGAADALWVDVLLAPTHARASADVDKAAIEIGSVWRDALLSLGGPADTGGGALEVHRGPALHREAGRIVCFGGLGPGELTLAGAKLLGMSQRRARWGARFQCQLQYRWAPEEWLGVIRAREGAPEDLLPLTVATIAAPPDRSSVAVRVAHAVAATLG
jgi:lipoate-protein ligase A